MSSTRFLNAPSKACLSCIHTKNFRVECKAASTPRSQAPSMEKHDIEGRSLYRRAALQGAVTLMLNPLPSRAEATSPIFMDVNEETPSGTAPKFDRNNGLFSENSVDGEMCATPLGTKVLAITEAIALAGAVFGGLAARQRKIELERMNEQLRTINLSLRQQARAGTLAAPGLSHAPNTTGPKIAPPSSPGHSSGNNGRPVSPVEPQPTSATAIMAPPAPEPMPTATSANTASMFSMDEEEMSPEQLQCRDALKTGKRMLKEKNGAASMVRFEKALMLSKQLGDKIQEKRAVRGLAASARLQGQYRMAIKHLERVLDISRESMDYTGDADAYGTIADCYAEMGEFERAAQCYDKYIDTMSREGPV